MADKIPVKGKSVAPAKAMSKAPVQRKAEAAKPESVKPEPIVAKPEPAVAKMESVTAKPAPIMAKPAAEPKPLTVVEPEPVKAAAPKVPAALPVVEPISRPVAQVRAPAEKTAPAALKPETKGMTIMAATAVTTQPQAAAAKVKDMIADLNDRTKTAFEKTAKAGEELTAFTKGNMEAFATSAKTAAKGAEALGQELADYGKKSFETASATMKSLAAVKTPTEMFQIQSEYAKSSFDSAVAEASKLSEAWLKLAGDVFQPLSSRYALAAEKIKTASL